MTRLACQKVLYVLERVFSLERAGLQHEVTRHKEGIIARHGAVRQGKIAAQPAELIRVCGAVREVHTIALPQSLDAPKGTVTHGHILGVPEGGTAGVGHGTARQLPAVDVPEGVAQAENAVLHLHAGGLLKGRLTVCRPVEDTAGHGGVAEGIERALLVKGLVGNYLPHGHICISHVVPLQVDVSSFIVS